ncbi:MULTISPECIES: hypothetical protein [Mycobacterium]|uniref:Uncharacterized protein n=1 Tax=Mycobacterium servetii TaxID=3237418 RepID=A0ABV4C7Z0_9MYCO
MPTLQDWIPQDPTSLDVVAPLRARACDALQAVLKRRRRPAPGPADARLMRRGAERC